MNTTIESMMNASRNNKVMLLLVIMLGLNSQGAIAADEAVDIKQCAQEKVAFDGIKPLKYADVMGQPNTLIPLLYEHPALCKSTDDKDCIGKAYLVPGDVVAVDNTCGEYTFVQYAGKKKLSYGWVEKSHLAEQLSQPAKATAISETQAETEKKTKTWKITAALTPEGPSLCKALVARLNSIPDHCSHDALETFPEFESPPWETLDPRKNMELLAKLNKYNQVGAWSYFNDQTLHSPKDYLPEIESAIKSGLSIQVWRTHLLDYYDSMLKFAGDKEQTVILVTYNFGAPSVNDDCPGKTSHDWLRQTYLVLPDLSGPDPRVDVETQSALSTAWPVFHHGEIRFVSGLYYRIYRNYQSAGLVTMCSFEQHELKSSLKRKGK